MNKVFGVGFHKTGTSTLKDGLKILGYNVCSTKIILLKEIIKNNYSPALELAETYDAFTDFPWPLIYKQLDQKFPGNKFILTIRDNDEWLKSNINHFGRGKRETLQLIYGASCPKGNEQTYLDRYTKHNRDILKYFEDRPDDLLVFNISKGDGWEKLCRFLNKEIPSSPFPHSQKGTYGIKKFRKRKNVIKLFLRIWAIMTGKIKKIKK